MPMELAAQAFAVSPESTGGASPPRTTSHESLDAPELFVEEVDAALPALRADAIRLGADPGQALLRDTLGSRLRALTARAGACEAPELAACFSEAEAVVGASAVLGVLDEAALVEILARIEGLMETLRLEELTPSGPLALEARGDKHARAVLVIGAKAHATALEASRDERSTPLFDVEHTDDAALGAELAPALGADVIVVDADLPGARELVAGLRRGALTKDVPVVVLGAWRHSEQAAPFLALGVARALPKPVSARALRRACRDLAPASADPAHQPIGKLSVDELGARLAEELQRGLGDAAEERGRKRAVDMGEGTEILTALWGAVGRIREHVTAKSRGAVRFSPLGPVSAVPAAPWVDAAVERKQAGRAGGPGEVRGAPEEALAGLGVLVADDDLAVNWFLAGLLRQSGAEVSEAFDGLRALALAYRQGPDVVLADVLMPGMGGLALCRALKRDLLLCDVPFVLLSWKDDLLDRARELGAAADGYLRKEASASTVLRRVRELVRPRRRVAARLALPGEVRGRLDGLTTHSLLRFAAAARPDARLSVRDAHYLYEIELRGGRPVAAGRVASDGREERGAAVLSAALGVRTGRFGLCDTHDEVAPELEGSLAEQVATAAAGARAAQGLLCGVRLARIAAVRLDEAAYGAYLEATPEPARGILRVLAAGAAPVELVQQGRATAQLLETVLADAALRGAVRAVVDRAGTDLLPDAVARELAILSGAAAGDATASGADGSVASAGVGAAADTPAPDLCDHRESWASPGVGSAFFGATPEPDAPTEGTRERTPLLTSDVLERVAQGGIDTLAPVAPSSDEHAVETTPAPDQSSDGASARASEQGSDVGRPRRKSRAERRRDRTPAAAEASARSPARVEQEPRVAASPPEEPRGAYATREPADEPAVPRVPRPSAYASRYEAPPPKDKRGLGRLALPLMFGAVGVALALGARWMPGRADVAPPPAQLAAEPEATDVEPLPAAQSLPPGALPDEPAGNAATPSGPEPVDPGAELPLELPLDPKDSVAQGEGVVEIVAGKKDKIYVDGKLIGEGPAARVTVKARPEPYEVRVKMGGEDRVRYVAAREGKKMRLRVAPPWSR
ncbi:MAG: response regulator [Polyangiaceae bacterium]|nr:response regulator [Polyangiaceae bacterium]